jgi:hypothetical protein
MAQDRRAETHGGDASSSQAKLDTRIGGLCRQTRVTNALTGCAATRNVGMDRMAATPAAMGLAPASALATRVLKVIRSVPATRVVKVIRSDLATGRGRTGEGSSIATRCQRRCLLLGCAAWRRGALLARKQTSPFVTIPRGKASAISATHASPALKNEAANRVFCH